MNLVLLRCNYFILFRIISHGPAGPTRLCKRKTQGKGSRRGTLRLCPSHTDLVALTRLCKSEASVKLLHGLGPGGHVMPVSHGLACGSMHIHEPLCFISLVYEFWREDYSILATYSLEFVLLPPVVKVWFWNVIVPIRGWVVWESCSPHCTNFMKIIYIYTFTAHQNQRHKKNITVILTSIPDEFEPGEVNNW